MAKSLLSSFFIFLLYRLSSVIIIQTFYVPDEYWQSLEVAHEMAFGYGYLTWEWKHGLRSHLYPAFFAILYKALSVLHLDFPLLIIVLPRILQAGLTAVSDQCFILLCREFGFHDYWPKIYIFTNWFWYYCGCRTITNTFETAFTIIALYYYPWNLFVRDRRGNNTNFEKIWPDVKDKSVKYIILSGFNCVIRPTAITIWGPLFLFQLTSVPLKYVKQFLIQCVFPVFLVVLFSSLIIDFFWYGKIIIPAYNFLLFNIVKDVSSFYGTHPNHWYITQGLPVVLGLHLVPFIFVFLSIFSNQGNKSLKRVLIMWLFIVMLNIIILSHVPHKEFRFILPLLPLMMLGAVKASSDFFTPSRGTYKKIWTVLLILSFLIPTSLFGIIHQRGTLQIMNYLRNSALDCRSSCLYLFLTPCHSTPLYSHLHVNVSTRFLTCEPPLVHDNYDESEDFFNDPNRWLAKYWDDKHPPTHVVFFDRLKNTISPFLEKKGFVNKEEFFHTIFPEGRVGRYIVVYGAS